MKKLILYIVSILFLTPFTSCEEEESPLLFSTDKIINPENVKIDYYSPDPSCVSKMYWISANSCASEITIKCTNANALYIENHEGKLSEEYISSQGQWKAKIVDSNSITFSFEDIDSNLIDESYSVSEGLNVVGETKKGSVRTGINIIRLTKSTEPIDNNL